MAIRALLAGLLSLCMIALTSCTPASTPLRIGINAWPGYEFLYLAQQKGFYAEAGVAVEIVEFQSLADARRAFERGQIDGWGTTVFEVLQATDQSNRKPKIIQIADYSDGADVVLAQPRFESLAALKGARVGVELGSVCVYVLARSLALHGMALNDVVPVSMDQTSMAEAFGRGELDAVVTYPPFSVSLARTNTMKTLFSSKEIPGEVLDVIALDAEVIETREQDVQKLIQAYQRAVEYAATNPADANPIMAKREGITAEEFTQALNDGITIVHGAQQAELFASGKLTQVVEATGKVLHDTGQIKQAISAASVIDTRFIKHAP